MRDQIQETHAENHGVLSACRMYRQSQATYLRSQGFLAGLMPGAVATSLLTPLRQGAGTTVATHRRLLLHIH